jgi:hypothetical protein
MSDLLAPQFGAWRVIGSDPTGRRVWCRCKCGAIREVSREALELGESQGCGACTATQAWHAPERPLRAPVDWRPKR